MSVSPGHVSLKRSAGGILAVAGGLLMLASGYSSRGFLFTALNVVEPQVSNYLSGVTASAIILAIAVIELLVALGGLTVAVGGLVILAKHTTMGRLLVALGGGAGFLGLLISLGYSAYRLGIDPVLGYLPYWIGLALAVTGRRLAKGA